MDIYREIYELASSAGALEGYVYEKKDLDPSILDGWIKNLVKQYHNLPLNARESFQASFDRTIGRAVCSLITVFGEGHEHVRALKSLIVGGIPDSFQDFSKEKKEKAEKYGQ